MSIIRDHKGFEWRKRASRAKGNEGASQPCLQAHQPPECVLGIVGCDGGKTGGSLYWGLSSFGLGTLLFDLFIAKHKSDGISLVFSYNLCL